MDEIILKAEELKETLKETKEYQEYLRVKALYDASEEIKSLHAQMKIYRNNPTVLERVNKEYNSHPLAVNYEHAKKELESILRVVKDIIEK